MVLSALLFLEMTCEVGLAKLDLENLKTEIFGEKCQKGREHPESLAPNAPLASKLLWVLAVAS